MQNLEVRGIKRGDKYIVKKNLITEKKNWINSQERGIRRRDWKVRDREERNRKIEKKYKIREYRKAKQRKER